MSAKFKLTVTQDIEDERPAPSDALWRALYGWIWIGYLLVIALGATYLFL